MFIDGLGLEVSMCEAHFDANRCSKGPSTCPEAAWPLSPPATSSQLLNVVHQAVQMPLRVDLLPAAQVESAQAFVVPDVGKHRFHRANALAVQLPASWRINRLTHAVAGVVRIDLACVEIHHLACGSSLGVA